MSRAGTVRPPARARAGWPPAVAVLLASCTAAAPATTAPAASAVRLGLVEWHITTSARALTPGAITLHVTNAGTTAHDLQLEAVDGTARTGTTVLAPGGDARLTAEVAGATAVRLWCSLRGHRAQGMELVLPVTSPHDGGRRAPTEQ